VTVRTEGLTKVFHTVHGPTRAVDDVTLRCEPGTATSVIGRNGAGKSTFLRLLAGVDVPTSGTVRRPRRCATLLELGAGFHPDLTGRENLDLLLALAGIPRSQRRARRDAAIDFSGLGRAVDRPVKRFSNGMIGRLGCALAVHTDPDLLLVDEILAVGDESFQRDMLARVADLVAGGAVLVLVTHSPELAAAATERSVWLDHGRVEADGPTADVLVDYQATVRGWGRASGDSPASFERIELVPDRVEPGGAMAALATIACERACGPFELRLELRPAIGDDTVWMRHRDETAEMRHLNLVAATFPVVVPELGPGRHEVRVDVEDLAVSPTLAEVSLVLADQRGIVDEISADVAIGDPPMRPHYHLRARPATAG
jgi:ABC-type polysaccharide/polyol phosphate transport system ATPase subunit